MNTEPIDIIVPWVNPNDVNWKNEFTFWKEKETGNQDDVRFNDSNTLKYVLRSIAENCPWCRYVFLVLSSKMQIPDWLNVQHPKLKIVFHKDFIPEVYLPTFNSLLIEMFYYNISEVSENFILINDDMFFCQKKDEDFFFINDMPVIKSQIINLSDDNSEFGIQVKNSAAELTKLMNRQVPTFNTFHLPVSYNKSLCEFISEKLNLRTLFEKSKFRQMKNIVHFIFYYAHIMLNRYNENKEPRGLYQRIEHKKKKYIFDCPLICLNETECLDEQDIKFLTNELEKHFTNKSFEKL